MKEFFKRRARRSGVFVATTNRLGLEPEFDLARLTAESPLRTIFDVGGNFGQTACRFAEAFPQASIYSFEPVSTSFARLKEAIQPFRQVRAFNIALGEAKGTAQINLTDSAGSNSLRQVHASTGSETIQVETVDGVVEANAVEGIDLLKIDVEGFEIPVLRGATRQLQARRIRFVYAECVMDPDPSMPHTNFFDLHSFLSPLGYCFVAYYAESFNLKSGCAMGNVLWALREQLPAAVPGNVANIA